MPGYNSRRWGTVLTLPKLIVLFCVLFMCKCVLYYCHQLSTQLKLMNISVCIYVTFIISIQWDFVCCSVYCLVCSRCDRPKCHYLLNLDYETCDILLSIVRDKKFDSHHNTAHCHVCCFSCRYGTFRCIQLPLFV